MLATILSAIAPVFAIIMVGMLLGRLGFPGPEFWRGADRLCYWVLFPCLLFAKISELEISLDLVAMIAGSAYLGFAASLIFVLLTTKLMAMDQPLRTSVLQGGCRHNTFVALAIAQGLFGMEGLALATLVSAFLIPLTNIAIVTSMVTMLAKTGGQNLFQAIIRDLIRNPLLVALALGFVANFLNIAPIPVISMSALSIGQASLPLILLSVGASITWSGAGRVLVPFGVSAVGKFVVFPFMLMVGGLFFGADPMLLAVLLVFGAVPTAPSSYTLAASMGGDSPAMASIITWQTALSFLTLPLSLFVAYSVFGLIT